MAGIWRWKTAQYAERKWWLRYLKNKEIQPYLNWKKKYWNQLLSKCNHYFDIKPEASIVDAGCGPAGVFMAFPNHQVVAFDPLIEAYENDLPHFKTTMYPNVQFVKSGIESFTYPQKFDIVFCMNAINHVHNIQKSFDHLVGLLADDGHLIITIDAHTHTFFKKLFRLLPGDILHPHQFDLNEYQKMLIGRDCIVEGTELLKHEFFFDHYMLIARKK